MLKGFVFLLLDFASIYTKSMLNASIFLLQNASICTISTHFASIVFDAKCVDIANAFCNKKNQNVPIVTLVQNALYQEWPANWFLALTDDVPTDTHASYTSAEEIRYIYNELQAHSCP